MGETQFQCLFSLSPLFILWVSSTTATDLQLVIPAVITATQVGVKGQRRAVNKVVISTSCLQMDVVDPCGFCSPDSTTGLTPVPKIVLVVRRADGTRRYFVLGLSSTVKVQTGEEERL